MVIGQLTPEEMKEVYAGIAARPLAVRQQEHRDNVTMAKWMFGCDNDDCALVDDGVPTS